MSCAEFRDRIEEYRGGEMAGPEAAAFAAHLRECVDCRRELDLLGREELIYRDYETKLESSFEVPASLWERAVAADDRGRADRNRGRSGWIGGFAPRAAWIRQALAAAILVAISVTATLVIVRNREPVPPPSQAAGAVVRPPSLDDALKSIQRAEQEYLNAIQVLTAVMETRKSTLDPRILNEIQVNLRMIDQHIAAARQAYYSHPADAELAIAMLAAYSRKVELLQDLAS